MRSVVAVPVRTMTLVVEHDSTLLDA